MVFARSAAMAFNRLMDRDVDAMNPRTATRHIPAGLLSVQAVWAFFILCSAGFIGSTSLFLLADPTNPWPIFLSVPVLVFICLYSLTKRFTALSHFWLGASLLLAPVAAWIAIRGLESLTTPGLLGLAVLFWVAGFDILYACQDAEFDRKAKLHSVPAALGVQNALRVAMLCHAVMVGLLVALALVEPLLGWSFLIAVGVIAALLVYEHSLVKAEDLGRVNQAFFQVNAVISIGLFVVVLLGIAL
jgi:4-hydroxybenzoate polyprenyltransferase